MVTITPDAESAAQAAAQRLADAITSALSERRTAHLALAGGTTPRRAYELLAASVSDWSGVSFWLGDERMLPAGDRDRNDTMLRAALTRPDTDCVPRIETVASGDPESAARRYEARLRGRVTEGANGVPVFDLVILGLGEDGHTASLFPGHTEVEERERLVVAVFGAPKPPPERTSMTIPLLSAARSIVILATGPGKASAVGTLSGPSRESLPPGRLPWDRVELICDREAAAHIGRPQG